MSLQAPATPGIQLNQSVIWTGPREPKGAPQAIPLAVLGGEASVAAMAEHLGRPADGLYYHLRALTDAGLVEEARDGRLPGGRAQCAAAD